MTSRHFLPRPCGALLLGLAALSLLAASCGRAGRKPVFPVRGQVLFEGRPAPNALVVFHPLGESRKDVVRPRGQVQADGTFTLSTYGAGDGAPAGEYAVTVEWWLSAATAAYQEGEGPPATNRLNRRYGNPATSGLRARVAGGPNELPAFQLTR